MSAFSSSLGRGAAYVIGGTALCGLVCASPADTRALSDKALVNALKGGGYVILLRHAEAPAQRPSSNMVEPDNASGERQLDQAGRDSARNAGAAIRLLGIPIGDVYCSPTYRARETARLAGLRDPRIEPGLGDGGASMSSRSVDQWAAWLKQQVATKPKSGTDTVFVTQYPNILSAFPEAAKGLADGGALVLKPDGKTARVVIQIQMMEWPKLVGTR